MTGVKEKAKSGLTLRQKMEAAGRAAIALYEAKHPLAVDEMAARVGVGADALRSMAKRRRSWEGWPEYIRFRDDVFSMAPALDWIEAAVTRTSSRSLSITAEDSQGERFTVFDEDSCSSLLPGDTVLLVRGLLPGGEAQLAGMFARPACRASCLITNSSSRIAHLAGPYFEGSFVALDGAASLPETIPPEGLRVVVEVAPRAAGMPEEPHGNIVEVLGSALSPAAEFESVLEEYALPREFPPEVLEEAEGLPADPGPAEAAERVDLRDIAFVTIDGDDAKDFDDAVWCCSAGDGWRLLVAIADVSRYVAPGSPLDVEAQARGTSVYFPDTVIPMLPEKLSNGLCSLNPGVDRAVMVCDMMVGADGKTAAYQFYPGLIHSHARLTYGCVWDALQGKPEDFLARGGSESDLAALNGLYHALRKARAERGAIDFETVETRVITGTDGLVEAIVRREHNDAHRIIEECMLAANVCAADFITRKRHPALYRIHEEPAPDRLAALRSTLLTMGFELGGGAKPGASDYGRVIDEVKDTPLAETVQAVMLRSMQRAVYSPENCGHYGLAYPAYTHFTSPIRRYPDLLVHRVVRALIAGKKYAPQVFPAAPSLLASYDGRKILREAKARSGGGQAKAASGPWAELGLSCSMTERRADSASRDVVLWLKCRFAEKLAGQRLAGTVTGVNRAGLYVTLDDPYIEGFVHVSKIGDDYYEYDESRNCFTGRRSREEFGIGKRVEAGVESSDAEMRRIDFSLGGGGRRGRSSGGGGRSWDWEAEWKEEWKEDCGEF